MSSAAEKYHTPFSLCFLDQLRILNESRNLGCGRGDTTDSAGLLLLFAGVPSTVSAVGGGCSFLTPRATGAGMAGSVVSSFCFPGLGMGYSFSRPTASREGSVSAFADALGMC